MIQNVLDLLTPFASGYMTKFLPFECAPAQLPQEDRRRVPTNSDQALMAK
jgi:hypothetical protein